MQTRPGIHFEAVASRDDLISALRAIKQEWRDSLGIEETGVFGPDRDRWELCSRVLSRRDVAERLSIPW